MSTRTTTATHPVTTAASAPGTWRRSTRQRTALLKVLVDSDRPLQVNEVLQRAQAQVGSLNEATVYRNLRVLVEEGHLVQLAHPEAGTLFEQAGKPHHHHFFCRCCLRVFNLPGCPLDKVKRKVRGFVTEGHDIFFRGLCRQCADNRTTGVAS